MNIKKCGIYTRVSTDNQAEKEFNSCETQEIKIRRFIESQEDMTVYKVYSDPGFTGANINRPALQKLINDIEHKRVDIIISYKIDRLTRSPKDFYNLVEIFEKSNVDFISVTERFDTSTPTGRLMRNIMLMFGQFERELTSERTRDKMLERARKGMRNGGTTPYGYMSVKKKLTPHPEKSKHIELLFETFVDTGSLAKARAAINRYHNFSKGYIASILRNPVYAGKIRYDGIVYDGIHEGIISEEVFNMAQTLHPQRIKRHKLYKHHLFASLVKCDTCGSTMTTSYVNKHRNGKLKRYFYYQCTKTKKYDWNSCPTRQVNSDKLERYLASKLESISNDKYYLEALVYKLSRENMTLGDRQGVELSKTEIQFSAESLRRLLLAVLKIIHSEKGASRNLKIKKYISEIIYSPEEIKIEFKTESLFDSSADLSTMTADRRQSQDESSGLLSLPDYAERDSARLSGQALGGVSAVSYSEGSREGCGCEKRILAACAC